MASVLRNGKHAHDNANEAGKGPEDGKGIQIGQPPVAQGGHGVAQQGDGKEDEVDLPGLGGKDADSGLALEDIDARGEEQGGAKVHGEGDGDVPDDKGPAADPGHDQPVRGRGKHEGLIVHAPGCGIDARNFTQ